jgi:hypothetical protein
MVATEAFKPAPVWTLEFDFLNWYKVILTWRSSSSLFAVEAIATNWSVGMAEVADVSMAIRPQRQARFQIKGDSPGGGLFRHLESGFKDHQHETV